MEKSNGILMDDLSAFKLLGQNAQIFLPWGFTWITFSHLLFPDLKLGLISGKKKKWWMSTRNRFALMAQRFDIIHLMHAVHWGERGCVCRRTLWRSERKRIFLLSSFSALIGQLRQLLLKISKLTKKGMSKLFFLIIWKWLLDSV